MSTGTCPAAAMARSTAATYDAPLGKLRSSDVWDTKTRHLVSPVSPTETFNRGHDVLTSHPLRRVVRFLPPRRHVLTAEMSGCYGRVVSFFRSRCQLLTVAVPVGTAPTS